MFGDDRFTAKMKQTNNNMLRTIEFLRSQLAERNARIAALEKGIQIAAKNLDPRGMSDADYHAWLALLEDWQPVGTEK